MGLRRIWDSISGDLDDVAASEENGLPFPQAGVVQIKNFIDDPEEAAMAKTHVFIAIEVWTDGGDAHPESNAVFRLRGIQGGGVKEFDLVADLKMIQGEVTASDFFGSGIHQWRGNRFRFRHTGGGKIFDF